MSSQEEQVDRWVLITPPAEMSADEFEQFVAAILRTASPGLSGFEVQRGEKIPGSDGEYVFDATVRFSCLGLDYLTIVEDKYHSNPIKRELVQVLYSKAQSVGAHKAILISTAPFQRGAIKFAKAHGVALVMVSEGRFNFETRGATPRPRLSRDEARTRYGIPTFVAVCFGPGGNEVNSTSITRIDPGDTKRTQETIFDITTGER